MNPKEFFNAVKKGDLTGIYLFLGPETRIARQMMTAAVEAMLPETVREFNLSALNGDEIDPVNLSAYLSGHPLMADKRFVCLRHLEDMPATREEGVLAALKAAPATSVILIQAGQTDRRRKFGEWLQHNSTVIDCPQLKPGDAVKWVEAQLDKNGVRAEPGVAQEIVRRVGTDLNTLSNELEKLVMHCDAGMPLVTRADCEALVPPVPEDRIFALLDAVGERNPGKSIAAARSLAGAGQAELYIIYMLARQIRQLYLCKYLADRGASLAEVGKALNLKFEFQARQLARQSGMFSQSELQVALRRVRDGEAAIKTGLREAKIELELLLLDLCMANRR